jgi:hypothetical protein
MINTLRKGTSTIYVGYVNGNNSELFARNFTLDASGEAVVLSIDLSPNQRVRNKESNCYYDINELLESLESVKYFEMYTEEWLKPLATSVGQHPTAVQKLEISFKDGSSRRYDGVFRKPSSNLIFSVASNNKATLSEDER